MHAFSRAGGVPASSISISSLDSDTAAPSSAPLNESVLKEFNQQINTQANLRDYLMSFTQNLVIASINSIELQASSLAQLTGATNQLTRNSAVRKQEKERTPENVICLSVVISVEEVS